MKRFRSPRSIWMIVRFALAALVMVLWFKAMRAAVIVVGLNARARTINEEILNMADEGDIPEVIEKARASLDTLDREVADLRQTLWPFEPVMAGMEWLPGIGRDIAAAPHMIEMVDSLLDAAHYLDAAYSPWLGEVLSDDGDKDILNLITRVTQDKNENLDRAKEAIAAAHRARQSISHPELLDHRLRDALEKADRILGLLDKGTSAISAAPRLLGVDGPQHVLILLHNADELRATGGFITASAYMVIDHGKPGTPIVLPSSSPEIDSEMLQYGEPPLPFLKYMHLINWYFRDANWWADFPTSAEKAASLYTAGTGRPVDTVIGINQYAIRDLIGAIGPIELDDGTVIGQENTLEAFQDQWTAGPGAPGTSERKVFIQDLAPLFMQKALETRDMGTLINLWHAQQAISDRHDLLIYSRDADIQMLSQYLGTDGSIPTSQGDYLYVLDTNVGWNKTDLIMGRKMEYHVDLSQLASPIAQLDLVYDNPSRGRFAGSACHIGPRNPETYPQRADDCYVNFIRLYLPHGTQLQTTPPFTYPESYVAAPSPDASQFVEIEGEGNKSVFGALMLIRPNRTREMTFTWSLPAQEIFRATPDGIIFYELTIPKQPGRQPFPVTVTVTLPGGADTRLMAPEPARGDGNSLIFEAISEGDIHIQIAFFAGSEVVRQLGLDMSANANGAQTPRVVATFAPLPTARPTAQPTPTASPTASPTAAP